jgi:hypothetical protein
MSERRVIDELSLVTTETAAPRVKEQPPPTQTETVAERVWRYATCCFPIRMVCTLIFTVIIVVLLAVIVGLFIVRRSGPVGEQVVDTLLSQVSSVTTGALINYINGIADSDLANVAYRRFFNTASAVPYRTDVGPLLQGWLDSRSVRLVVSIAFGSVDESTLGPLVLAYTNVVDRAWATAAITGAPRLPLENSTWTQTIACGSDPANICQRVHGAILQGDRMFLQVLKAGTQTDVLPPVDDTVLFRVEVR